MAEKNVISLGNDTKTKTPREAYISDEHVKTLKELFSSELLDEADNSVLSPIANQKERYNKTSLTRMLNSVLHQALGKQYTTHSFRAGYIITLHQANVSIKTISKVIGHTKEVTTMKYITVSEDERREAVKAIRTIY